MTTVHSSAHSFLPALARSPNLFNNARLVVEEVFVVAGGWKKSFIKHLELELELEQEETEDDVYLRHRRGRAAD